LNHELSKRLSQTGEMKMNMITTTANGKTHEVKQTGNKFFYFSRRAGRWLPVAKAKVKTVSNVKSQLQ